jgi:hypothetical protein
MTGLFEKELAQVLKKNNFLLSGYLGDPCRLI